MNLSRWGQAVVVAAGGAVALVALHVLCIKEGGIPLSALRPSFDPAELPTSAQVSAVAMTGLVAAVVEEAAYRGYLQSCLERLWSPRLAIVTIAAVFTLAHLPAAWSYPVVLIFIFAAGILFGSVATIFGSIRPCVLLHAFVDWLVLPIEWGLVGRRWLAPLEVAGLDEYAMGLLVVAIVSGAATVWTLARVVRRTPEDF
jgi:membrane protease YdiL (CAAX protease family)